MHIAARAPAAPASRPPKPSSLRAGVVHGVRICAEKRTLCPARTCSKAGTPYAQDVKTVLPLTAGSEWKHKRPPQGCGRDRQGNVRAACPSASPQSPSVATCSRQPRNFSSFPDFELWRRQYFGGVHICTTATAPNLPATGPTVPTPHIHIRPAIPPFSHHLGYAADGWLGMLGDLRAYEHGSPDKC